MSLVKRLWSDEAGFVLSAEMTLIATILVIGMVVGLTSVRDQVVQELGDVGAAISQLNQSYSYSAITGHHSSTAGSRFNDETDSCDDPADRDDVPPLCINVCEAAGPGTKATDE